MIARLYHRLFPYSAADAGVPGLARPAPAACIARPAPFIGYCDHCHGPIARKTAWHLVREAMAFDLWTALPPRLAFSRPGEWLLGHAAGHAFTCTCPSKCRA